MATGEILRLKCVTLEGVVPVDPGFIAMFLYECDFLTCPASSLVSGGCIDVLPLNVRCLMSCP
jgi:hypothetical protein